MKGSEDGVFEPNFEEWDLERDSLVKKRRSSVDESMLKEIRKKAFEERKKKLMLKHEIKLPQSALSRDFSRSLTFSGSCLEFRKKPKKKKLTWAIGNNLETTHEIIAENSVLNSRSLIGEVNIEDLLS